MPIRSELSSCNLLGLNYELEKSGMPLRSGLPSCNLLWLNQKNFLQSEHTLYFYTLGDYIISALTGKNPISHPTNAAATGLFDLTTSQWNKDYIAAICEEKVIFPEIGTQNLTFTLSGKNFTVKPAIGDQQAALLGSGLCEKSQLSFNIGTGGQVSRIIDTPKFGDYQVRPYFFGKYIRTIPHIPSGRALNVYFRFIKDIAGKFNSNATDAQIWHEIKKAAEAGTNSGIECDMSFFENAITNHTQGSITNISEYSLTMQNVMRAVVCKMADNFVKSAEKVNDGLCEVENVIFSGGIAGKWPLLVSLIVERLNLNVPVKVSQNDTLYGLCRYAEL